MKLRRLPEDFHVQELAAVPADGGPFALYRMTKRSLGTPEAVAAISRQLNLPRQRFSYGGLKDRHAVTVQYLTIRNGPRRDLQQRGLQLEYLGQTRHAWTSRSIHGNRFRIVIRSLLPSAESSAQAAAPQVASAGVPNYFDDQRFGSLGISGDWIARAWCLGDYDRALWLALADPHRDDSAAEKQQKQILRDHWGDWPQCKALLSRSHRRSIVTYLADKVAAGRPPDARGAFARIRIDLRGLYLSAWQSALWNRWLCRIIDSAASDAILRFPLQSGEAVFPTQSVDSTRLPSDLQLPLPSARMPPPDERFAELLDSVLAEEHVTLPQLKVKYPRDSFFSRARRPAWIRPHNLTLNAAPDELSPQRRKLQVEFELPRGAYATMVIRRLMAEAETTAAPPAREPPRGARPDDSAAAAGGGEPAT